VKLIAEEEEFNLPYLFDGDTQKAAKAYGAVATPHIFIFDSELKLRYNGRIDDGRRSRGETGKNEARDALTAILAGKEPEVIKTRPIGCTTKWKEKAGLVAKEDARWKALPVTVESIDAQLVADLVANKDRTGMRLFNIWSTTCGPCVAEFPDLVSVYRQHSWQQFEFIPISLDPASKKDAVVDFLKRQQSGLSKRAQKIVKAEGRSTNNYLFEGDTEDLANALDPEWNGAIPHTILVGANGEILYRHTGRIDPFELKKAIVEEVWKDEE
jgi:thiol-disulfide isomerase/thioredoxin